MPDPWSAVEALAARSLDALFEAESDRVARLSVEESGIRFDFSKTHLDAAAVRAFAALAQAQDLAGARAKPCSPGESSTRPKAAPPSTAPSAARGRRKASPAPRISTPGCVR